MDLHIDELPYSVEYSRSEQSSCKKCFAKIPTDELRIARVYKSPLIDRLQNNWYHARCFFDAHRPKTVGDFDGFETIRFVDQEYLIKQVAQTTKLYECRKGTVRNPSQIVRMSTNGRRDFGIEYARTSRARCRVCALPIHKQQIRARHTVFDSALGMRHGGEQMFYHYTCFVPMRRRLGWLGGGDELPGFGTLQKVDQLRVQKAVSAMQIGRCKAVGNRRPFAPECEEVVDPERLKLLQAQNVDYYRHRDYCQRNLSKKEWQAILKLNSQRDPKVQSRVLDAIADTLTFGALEQCPRCLGQLVLRRNRFQCIESTNKLKPCDYVNELPNRRAAVVPCAIREKHPFLEQRYPIRHRLFYNIPSRTSIEANDATTTTEKSELPKEIN